MEDLYVNVKFASTFYEIVYELCWDFQNLNLNGLIMLLMH